MKIRIALVLMLIVSMTVPGCGSAAGTENATKTGNSLATEVSVVDSKADTAGSENSDTDVKLDADGSTDTDSQADKGTNPDTDVSNNTDEQADNDITPDTDAQPENGESTDGNTDSPSSDAQDTTDKNKLTVDDNFDLSGVSNAEAAALFKDFLLGNTKADLNGESVSLGDLLASDIIEFGYEYDSNSETMLEYFAGNCALDYVITEAGEPALYIEIMNIMMGGNIYQIKADNGNLLVNSVLGIGWSDTTTVYDNGYMSVYHGQHIPAVWQYFDAKESMINIYDGGSKAKLLIWGPKGTFEDDFDQANEEYQKMAENVLVFDDEPSEVYQQRNEILGMDVDKEAIEWKKLEIKNFEQ